MKKQKTDWDKENQKREVSLSKARANLKATGIDTTKTKHSIRKTLRFARDADLNQHLS